MLPPALPMVNLPFTKKNLCKLLPEKSLAPVFGRRFLFSALVAVLSWPENTMAGYSAHVVEANTGSVLHSHKPNAQNFPASLGKVMTLYLVFRGLDMGDFSLDTRMTISHYAARQPPSKLGLPAGDTISIRDSILALTTKSANDIASSLAEFMTGTEREFAKTMTKHAKLLGMTNTIFRNASGLPHSQQRTTALDMTILGRALYADFPHYCHFFEEKKFTFRGKTYRNHNSLLGVYPGVNGVKTGYIRASGFHLMASGLHNSHQVIAVVLGGKTARSRDNQMKRLLDRAYHALDRNDQILNTVVVPPGKPKLIRTSPTATIVAVSEDSGTKSVQVENPPTEDRLQETTTPEWAIQLGAFTKAHAAKLLLNRILEIFPAELKHSVPQVSPIITGEGTLFRARHLGLTQKLAQALCSKLLKQAQPCIVVAP